MTPEEIVKRLREIAELSPRLRRASDVRDAADLIEQQAKALEEAEKALEPFVVPRDAAHAGARTDDSVAFEIDGHEPKVGDFRRARAALATIRHARVEK